MVDACHHYELYCFLCELHRLLCFRHRKCELYCSRFSLYDAWTLNCEYFYDKNIIWVVVCLARMLVPSPKLLITSSMGVYGENYFNKWALFRTRMIFLWFLSHDRSREKIDIGQQCYYIIELYIRTKHDSMWAHIIGIDQWNVGFFIKWIL